MTNLFGHKNAHLAALLFGGWRYWKQEKNRWLALSIFRPYAREYTNQLHEFILQNVFSKIGS